MKKKYDYVNINSFQKQQKDKYGDGDFPGTGNLAL
jgi:hypothetical protein